MMRYPDYYSPPSKAHMGCGALVLRVVAIALAVWFIVWIWRAI